MYRTETNRITVDATELDVKATLECGQLFRFEKTDDGYTVKSGGNTCEIRTSGNYVVIDTAYVDYFVNFFNLDRDVTRAKRELSRFPELTDALNSCGALRILHQPLFETIISFIISANNNIPRIKSIINRLCGLFGDVFPTPQQIAEMPLRQLNAIGCGYRSQYILNSATICANTNILDRLHAAATADASKLLMTLPGVGQKIADCVALFALGRLEVFPIDTWMFKTQRIGMETESQLRTRLMEKYGTYAGYAQQVLYYYNAILRKGV
ncbi:MAG: DNA-3-methyladenine glycosylase 2 family protein [Clostridiales bacterium]|nr:DNA-3-methyladenine glycosylase 2 family protein [Clostridiales bacterium]